VNAAPRYASVTVRYKRRITTLGGTWGNASIEATSEVGATSADVGYAYGSDAQGARPVDLFRFDAPLTEARGDLHRELLAMIAERDAEELAESPEDERAYREHTPHRNWLRTILENAY
jgi:hypothetical protein